MIARPSPKVCARAFEGSLAYPHLPSTMRRIPVRLFIGSAFALTLALGLGGVAIMQAAQQPPAPPAGAAALDISPINGGTIGGASNGAPQDVLGTSLRVRVLIEMQQPPAAASYAAVL